MTAGPRSGGSVGGIGIGGILVIIGIVLMIVWSFWIGLIILLIGLVAFGGFAKGKWYWLVDEHAWLGPRCGHVEDVPAIPATYGSRSGGSALHREVSRSAASISPMSRGGTSDRLKQGLVLRRPITRQPAWIEALHASMVARCERPRGPSPSAGARMVPLRCASSSLAARSGTRAAWMRCSPRPCVS
jgi:hypothetical protein